VANQPGLLPCLRGSPALQIAQKELNSHAARSQASPYFSENEYAVRLLHSWWQAENPFLSV